MPQAQGLVLGVALRNVGPDVKFQLAREKLPTEIRAGAGYTKAAFGAIHTLAFDVGRDRYEKTRGALGVESVLGRVIALRLGYTSRNEAGIGATGGVGFIWKNARVDYAIVPFDSLGVAHRVSLTYRWGEPAP